jgi:peptidoglycan-associated lipoprotein
MKTINLAKPIILGIALGLAAAGCKSTKPPVTQVPPGGTGTGTQGDPGSGGKLAGGTNPDGTEKALEGIAFGTNHSGWTQNRVPLQADTVHFDYDKSTIRTDEKPKVAAVADYMKGNTAVAVLIEGHCDERGTEEYNRALGERRALALREELAHLGIDANRVDTMTFGRDRPVDTGHSEAAHAKNRRGEFVVLTAPK